MYFSCSYYEKLRKYAFFQSEKALFCVFILKKMRIYAIFQSENDLVKRKISNFAPDKTKYLYGNQKRLSSSETGKP